MALREILAVFGVEFDGKPLDEGNRRIDDTIGSLKQLGVAVAGAFAVGKVKDFVFGLAQVADNINKTARRLNTNAIELQAWQHGAELAGVSSEMLEGAILKLGVSSFRAEEGGKALTEAFKKLGVEATNTDGTFKDAGQQFEEVGIALSKIENSTERVALATELFGRGAARQLLSLFEKGAPSIKEFRAELQALGGGFDQEFLDNSEAMNDNMTRLQLAMTSLKVKIAGFLLPAISAAAIRFAHWVASVSKVIKSTNIAQAGFVLLGLSGLAAVNKLLKFGQLAKIFTRWLLPLALALVVLDEIITFAQGGDTVLGKLIDKGFGAGASEKVRKFFGDVKKANAEFFRDLQKNPAKFEQDWKDAIEFLRKDIEKLSPAFANVFQSILDVVLFTWDVITGNWSKAGDKIGQVASLAGLVITGAFEQAKLSVMKKFSEIGHTWANLWNTAVQTASNVVKKIGDALGGSSNFIGEFFTDAAEKLAGIKIDRGGSTEAIEGIRQASGQELRAEISRRIDNIRGGNDANPNVVVQAPITVNVPAGTPAQTANRVGQAAGKGVNRGAKAALGQRSGKR